MEIKEVAHWARNALENHGLGYCNVIFFNLVKPLGFAYRNVLALSLPFVKLNDWNTVTDVIAHEVGHLKEPDDHEHGGAWQWAAKQADSFQERTYSDEWEKLWIAYEADKELQAASKRYLADMVDTLDALIDASGVFERRVNYDTFAKGPIQRVQSSIGLADRGDGARKKSCPNGCQRVGVSVNHRTGIVRAVVANSLERVRGGWHTACNGCQQRFFESDSFEDKLKDFDRWARSQGIHV
jgi:hypothetical protein